MKRREECAVNLPGTAGVNPAGRLGDASVCGTHHAPGRTAQGSPNVLINGRPALRVGDTGVAHGGTGFACAAGARAVLINGSRLHRTTDSVSHCGRGALAAGSPDVLVGDWTGGKGCQRQPGVKLHLVWPDGTPLKELPYALESSDTRSGTLLAGELDERNVHDEDSMKLVIADLHLWSCR